MTGTVRSRLECDVEFDFETKTPKPYPSKKKNIGPSLSQGFPGLPQCHDHRTTDMLDGTSGPVQGEKKHPSVSYACFFPLFMSSESCPLVQSFDFGESHTHTITLCLVSSSIPFPFLACLGRIPNPTRFASMHIFRSVPFLAHLSLTLSNLTRYQYTRERERERAI